MQQQAITKYVQDAHVKRDNLFDTLLMEYLENNPDSVKEDHEVHYFQATNCKCFVRLLRTEKKYLVLFKAGLTLPSIECHDFNGKVYKGSIWSEVLWIKGKRL